MMDLQVMELTGDRVMGHLARPRLSTKAPAVVVIQEWWGLNDHIKDVTRRFAQEGFVALAPDLYHGQAASEPDDARKLAMQLVISDAVKEIQGAADYLLAQQYVAGSKVGVVGFCMGGALVLATARAESRMGAGVVFYGTPLKPEQASEVKAPILGLYGALDHIPVPDVQAMSEALGAARIANEIHVYEGAHHAFFNDTRQSYNERAAADAWQKTLAWFRRFLV